jgi:E3 ubiquitin-protein ligase SHPRH
MKCVLSQCVLSCPFWAGGFKALDPRPLHPHHPHPVLQIAAVVRRILYITGKAADNRLLVFSTWKDVLDLLAHALTANSVPHLYPKGGRHFEAALHAFRGGQKEKQQEHGGNEGSTAAVATSVNIVAGQGTASGTLPRVLLLLVKQGGNGLNIVEAQVRVGWSM